MANRGSFGSYEPSDQNYSSSYHAGGGRDNSNDFTRLSQVVSNNIQKITQNVAQIQRMVSQIGTSQDSAELRDKLHQIQHYTNQLAKEANRHLKDLSHLPATVQSEQRQRKMQKERLMNDFTAALNSFQAAQRKAAEKEKESVARVKAAHPGYNQDPFLDDRKGDEQLVSFESSGSQQQTSVVVEEDVDLEMLRGREQAIRQLESDIMDVNQIFKDLGMLVHEQGEVVDSIEANVDTAATHVQQGTSELQKAREYQSKARRKKCIIIIVILVVLAIIGLIIGLTVRNK